MEQPLAKKAFLAKNVSKSKFEEVVVTSAATEKQSDIQQSLQKD